jgi:uncharacterized SAM-binding protein YcdF (DUF218 family)
MATVSVVPIVVLVPGYGGRIRAVERWRIDVALRTLAEYGDGSLVLSGHQGEAERLALLASGQEVVLETTARSTWENVEKSIPYFLGAERLAIASDWFHAHRAERCLRLLRPDLSEHLVPAVRLWRDGWWIQIGGAVYAGALVVRRLLRSAR